MYTRAAAPAVTYTSDTIDIVYNTNSREKLAPPIERAPISQGWVGGLHSVGHEATAFSYTVYFYSDAVSE